jgi:hypothetical protein
MAGCGGGSSSSTGASGASGASGSTTTTAVANVPVTFQKPSSKQDALGAQLVKAANIGGLANILVNTFNVQKTIAVKGVNGIDGGPHYDPTNDTITFQYGFAALIYNVLKESNPDWSGHRLGFAVGSVESFIMEHEFTHALIHIYDIPVLGKEEDAADTLATLLLLKSDKGDKLALGAAEFWADFSGRQDPPALADYADEHSLDLQRAYSIVCDIAGSSKARYAEVAQLGILPKGDIQSCPAQYQQDVKSFTQVLEPHVPGGINLVAPQG